MKVRTRGHRARGQSQVPDQWLVTLHLTLTPCHSQGLSAVAHQMPIPDSSCLPKTWKRVLIITRRMIQVFLYQFFGSTPHAWIVQLTT